MNSSQKVIKNGSSQNLQDQNDKKPPIGPSAANSSKYDDGTINFGNKTINSK